MSAKERIAVHDRSRLLVSGPHYDVALVHYTSGGIHPRHNHETAQATLLLAGGFEDNTGRGGEEAYGQRFGFRPADSNHSCRFATEGALILSINWREAEAPKSVARGFRPINPRALSLSRLLVGGYLHGDDAVDDLTAVLLHDDGSDESSPRQVSRPPPSWLKRAADHLRDEPLTTVDVVAHEAGVHRVVLSRMFQRHFGTSPSLFRLQCKHARAMRLIIESDETVAAAAFAAGFADQSHLTRTARLLTGLPPARLGKFLGPSVTSAQDPAHQEP